MAKTATTREGKKYKALVKKLGVIKGAKEYRKWKREQKKGKKPQVKAKGGNRMAKKKKGAPTTAKGRKYRALVKKHGVMKAASMWRGMSAAKKGGKTAAKKKYAANPKGKPKTAKGKAYRALVKKHGVMKAASMWRQKGHKPAKKKYAANAWTKDKKGHSIASAAGWARRKGVPVPIYLSQRGFSKSAIDRYIGKHGPVGSSHRSYTKTYPARTPRYAMNPMEGAVETVKGVFQMETAKTVFGVGIGFMGMALGNAIVSKLKPDAPQPAVMAGEFGGSVLAGAVYAVATKDVGKGLLTASSGIALSVFKFAWTKWVAGNKYLGLTMPSLSDYVELPYAAGISDYVELPYTAGMGQSLDTGMGQFLPPEAAEVGQFIPEQFGEYTVGIGEEAEVEY